MAFEGLIFLGWSIVFKYTSCMGVQQRIATMLYSLFFKFTSYDFQCSCLSILFLEAVSFCSWSLCNILKEGA